MSVLSALILINYFDPYVKLMHKLSKYKEAYIGEESETLKKFSAFFVKRARESNLKISKILRKLSLSR